MLMGGKIKETDSNDYTGTTTVNRTKLEILAVLSWNLCVIVNFDPNRLYSFLCQCAGRPFRRIPLLISNTGQYSELSISAKQSIGWILGYQVVVCRVQCSMSSVCCNNSLSSSVDSVISV